MANAASEAAVASHRGSMRATARSEQGAATAAWRCAIPSAAIVVPAIVPGPRWTRDMRHLRPQAPR